VGLWLIKAKMNSNKTILLTIDVEDWFQVENFKPWIPFETWDQRELRVEKNTNKLLNLFDSIELKAPSSKLKVDSQIEKNYELSAMSYELAPKVHNEQSTTNYELAPKVHNEQSAMSYELAPKVHNELSAMPAQLNFLKKTTKCIQPGSYEKSHPKVTFFILGWIAERLPHLVREIHSRGHEVASHGYNHNLCNQQSHADLKQELIDSKKLLEDITGSKVLGFRAPNFSIDDDILKIIEDCGYLYDSSYNSFGLHGRYGQISLNGHSKQGIAHKISENFFELPISNLNLRNTISYQLSAISSGRIDKKRFVLPFGGGAYFRLMPFSLFKRGIKNILKKESAYLFYCHPWEIDSEQPRMDNASYFNKFKHYTNISQTEKKLKKLIKNLSYCQFLTCGEYLKEDRRL